RHRPDDDEGSCPALDSPSSNLALLPRSDATLRLSRAISSAGRAPSRQGGGRWFEPNIAHYRGLQARSRREERFLKDPVERLSSPGRHSQPRVTTSAQPE